MDAGTDWVRSRGRTGLDLDGTNDWVDAAEFSQITFPMTLECWFIPRAVTGIQRLLTVHTRGAAGAFLSLAMDTAAVRANSHNGAIEASATGGTLSTGSLYHAAAVFRGIADREIFLNGKSIATNTTSISAPASVNYAGIGALSWTSVIQFANAIIFDARISISANSKLIALSATRPGIAYELAPRRRSRVSVITSGFSALRPSILRGSR